MYIIMCYIPKRIKWYFGTMVQWYFLVLLQEKKRAFFLCISKLNRNFADVNLSPNNDYITVGNVTQWQRQ